MGYVIAGKEVKRHLKTTVSGLYCFLGCKDLGQEKKYLHHLLNKNTIFQ